MEVSKIIEIFKQEFAFIADKFFIYDLLLDEARRTTADHIWKPGIYILWKPTKVVKVGRHLTNARKRAFEHLTANTGGSMAALTDNPDARLLLFSLINPDDKHWVVAVEIFLERVLEPEVATRRLG